MASTIIVDKIQKTGGVPFTLPVADATASGQSLQSDASGNLSWGDVDPNSGKGSNISSADPLVIAAGSNYFIVTGTTGFNDMTVAADTHFFLEFAGALVMTHVGGALDLPSGAAITTVAGDVGEFFATATNVVTCVNYTRADGTSIALSNNAVDETKLKDALVADFTEVVVASGDSLVFGDATDSGNTKRDTVQGVLDLVHGATAGVSTIWIPAIAMVSPETNGAELAAVQTTATRPEIKVLDFDSSTREHAQFSIAMPKSWNESTVTAVFYWTHLTAVATNVKWAIQGVCVSDNDTINIAYGTAVDLVDTFHNAANDLAITAPTGAMTLDGTPAEDDLAYFQVYRDAAHGDDTTDSTDARLLGVKILFTTNAENDA